MVLSLSLSSFPDTAFAALLGSTPLSLTCMYNREMLWVDNGWTEGVRVRAWLVGRSRNEKEEQRGG